MKAIFMKEVVGILMEVERREITPRMDYYRAVYEPLAVGSIAEATIQPPLNKQEHWVCHAKPVGEDDFAVFLLKGIE